MSAVNVQDRRIEQYLSNFSRKYKLEDAVADFVAPTFKVNKSSDKYLVYNKSDFRVYDNKISGRSKALEIDLKADESSYACEEYSLATFIADRDLQNMDGVGTIRLKEDKISHVIEAQRLAREKRVLDVAGSTSLLTQASDKSAAWATAASGTPVADIINAMISVESYTGKKPNAILMSYEVAMTIIKTTEWKAYFQYTTTGVEGIQQAISGLTKLGLQPMISGFRGTSTYEIGTSDPSWELLFDEKCLIFYRETNPTPNSMTFMYSPFTKKDVVESYRVNGERGMRYEIYEEIDELLVNELCGYLYYNVV